MGVKINQSISLLISSKKQREDVIYLAVTWRESLIPWNITTIHSDDKLVVAFLGYQKFITFSARISCNPRKKEPPAVGVASQ